jgi:hypothetical protein
MSFTTPRRIAAVLAASAIAGGMLGAVPAQAGHRPSGKAPACTVTAAERAADRDQLKTLEAQLRGERLTTEERQALRDAISELVRAALDAKMPAAEREAKIAELRALKAELRTAATPEERTAIRAEIKAILVQLDAARLTKAELAELRAQIKELTRTMRGAVSGPEREVVKAELKDIAAKFRCKVVG